MRTYSRKKVEYQMIEGVKELCRLCLEKCEEVVPIFTDSSDVCAALPMRIMICVGLEMVREDCLPNIICQTCFKELERYYSFRKKCEVTYQKLKAHMLALKEKEANRPKVQVKEDVQDEVLEQNMEIHLQNGDVEGQLVLALNENKQLELVNVVGLNGVVQVCEKQEDQSSNQILQQCIENEIQMQDISTTSHAQSNETNEAELIPFHSEPPNEVDMSMLLSSILIRLGILNQQGDTLELVARGTQEVELEAGDGDRVILELYEEDDNTLTTSIPPLEEVTAPDEDSIHLGMETVEVHAPSATQPSGPNTSQTKKSPARSLRSAMGAKNAVGSGVWCEICGKSFSSRSVLGRHRRSHSAERPFACGDCGKMFTQRSVLNRHALLHTDPADRPFKCSKCPKSFTQRAGLKSHARSHAPPHARPLALHLCGSCPKVFLYPSGLSRHMSVHEGRVFTCDECRRQFTDKSALLRHLRTTDHKKTS